MKKFITFMLSIFLTASVFAIPIGNWWVPICNSASHDHEYHEYTGFQLCYEEQYEQPMFVSYILTNEQMNAASLARKNQFAEDTSITTGSATLSDYKGSGYSRGHLAPNSDMNYSTKTQTECFLLSNMSPQEQNYFNGGIWLQAENAVRDIGKAHDYCIVVTGPILDKTNFSTIGSNKVAVPDEFYKIAVFIDNDNIVGSFAVIMSQTNKLASKASSLTWDDPRFITDIKTIEERTGINFFATLEDTTENYLENYKYGSAFEPKLVELDNTKITNSTSYVHGTTNLDNVSVHNNAPVTSKVSTSVSFIKLVSNPALLYKNLSNKKYIGNIAKTHKITANEAFYNIGYYGYAGMLKSYNITASEKITYTDWTSSDLELLKSSIDDSGFSMSELCEMFCTDANHVLISLGVIKADLKSVGSLIN